VAIRTPTDFILPPDGLHTRWPDDWLGQERRVFTLKHPNIVTIYSVEEIEGLPCLTMELVDGEPLTERIASGGVTLDRLLDLAIPIAEAISVAHRTSIVHRDLKPANVMVTRDGRVKVLDFGLAKLMTSADADADATTMAATGIGMTLGTVAYMSPEQARGESVDERTDIFAFGAMLYEMATGRRLFHGDSSVAVLAAILEGDIQPIGGGYAELDRIIARAVAKKPHQRYQRIDEVLTDLQALRPEPRSKLRPSSRPVHRWRCCPSRT